ncbi:WD40-repeat-containing domain protein [Fomitopsis serialis]|uniref:WD40-repeat-containing domain protein n=1 Tax=Fomitopsis serialis TaxID=139415 RepID=UPI0020081A8A|nr:WD40-repeat-containing domain protein [Neoantrodia serialis]KAH9918679.1 WD40-repeat-containing domain protein [Neoantrodia serialis]
MTARPAEVYAQQLFKLGYGYPLWEPDPPNDEHEVLIGDVGYLRDGGFYRLFNAMKATEDADLGIVHDSLREASTPSHFRTFDLGPHPIVPTKQAIHEGPHFSDTVRQINIGGGAGSHNLNVAFQCECTDQHGALVILDTPGIRQKVHQIRRMQKYMKENIDNWHEWGANELGVDISVEDVLFVLGWVKTSRWAVVAFHGNSSQSKLTFKGDIGLPVSAAFHFDVANHVTAKCERRVGPDNRPRFDPNRPLGPRPQEPPTIQAQGSRHWQRPANEQPETDPAGPSSRTWGGAPESYSSDQCVFLHYLKLKKRRFFLPDKIKAAAEPRDPSMDRGADEDMEMMEEVPSRVTPYDPVTFVLDYILENSDAEIAIASDLDLLQLCKLWYQGTCPIPDDIPSFLTEVQPEIEVTDDGLGLLFFDDDEDSDIEMHIAAGPNATGTQSGSKPSIFNPADPFAEDHTNRGKVSTGGPALSRITVFAIAAGFEDNTIIIWNAMTSAETHRPTSHHAISSLGFSPDGRKLAWGQCDGVIVVWDLVEDQMIWRTVSHEDDVKCIAYSLDGTLVVSAAGNSVAKLWHVDTDELRAETDEHNGLIMAVVFSPDNKRFLSTSANGTAYVWGIETASRICDLRGHEGVIHTVAYSTDGKRVVTGSDDGTAGIWDALLGTEIARLRVGPAGVTVRAAQFSADGTKVHCADSEGIIRTYDSNGWDLINSIDCGDKLATAMTFSGDGRLLAAGGEDYVITVWDMAAQREIVQLSGHTDSVNYLFISHDYTYVVSASYDGTLRKWELPDLTAET